jgi:hypothetical protein
MICLGKAQKLETDRREKERRERAKVELFIFKSKLNFLLDWFYTRC